MITIYPAKTVITMNPSQSRAECVLVREGRILEAGTLASTRHWLEHDDHIIDSRFADKVILPGFIDPHLHPPMAAVILPMHFITPTEWRLPWGTMPACLTAEDYDQRLASLCATETEDDLLITWGHHHRWHGDISRGRINDISGARPVIVWNRSFHELTMNDAALTTLGISEEDVSKRRQIDWQRGRFYENGLGYAFSRLNPIILAPDRFTRGLQRLCEVVRSGGHTTIGDLAVGMFDFDTEMSGLQQVLDTPSTPFRTELVANGMALRRGRTLAEAEAMISALPRHNSHRLRYAKRVKLFADGAFFAELAQLLPPGYLDGHSGEWLMPPDALEEAVRFYWQRDYQIHVHVTGDLGVELALDILEKMHQERPRFRHGFTLEHFGYATPEQVCRAADLGAQVSANVYYLHELSALYAQQSVGTERAASMARLGSTMRAGITTALHSDFTMAPAAPLTSLWVAVNRLNLEGDVMAPEEKLSVAQGLQAITINAATILGREADIGSIRAGKMADFTVLAEDPFEVDPLHLKDIKIVATVFEGDVYAND